MKYKIWYFFLNNVAKPLAERLGTAVSASLIGFGVASGTASQIEIGLIALLGVGLDWIGAQFMKGGE